MSIDLLKICDPWAYYSQFLLESIYPNGRAISSFRPVSLQMGVAECGSGSSVTRQGATMIRAKVEPFLAARSDDTVIIPHIDAAPVVPQEMIDDAEDLLKQMIDEGAFVDRNQLIVADDRLMWVLHLHISILNVSGSFLDALVTCATGALLDVRLPRVELDLDEDMVPNTSDIQVTEQYESIQLADLPVLSTFIVLDVPSKNEMKILCDPPAELFELLPNQMNILVGNGGKIYRTVINGYCGDETIVQKLFALASSRQKVVAEALLAAKEAHLKKTLKN